MEINKLYEELLNKYSVKDLEKLIKQTRIENEKLNLSTLIVKS